MKGDFISCYLLLQPTLHNVSCEKNKLRPNNSIIAQLSKCTQVGGLVICELRNGELVKCELGL